MKKNCFNLFDFDWYRVNFYKTAFLCLLFSFSFLQKTNAQQKVDPLLDYAKQQISQNFYLPAISTLNSYLESHKNDTSALYWKAYSFYKLKNTTAALENYTLLLKLNPKCFSANVDLASIYTNEKKYETALVYYNNAISMNDTNVNLYNSRGMCYYYLDRFELAIKDFNRVLKLDPNNYLAYNNKGSATYNNQNIAAASIIDLKAAEVEFNKAIAIKSDFELAFRNRGIIRYYMDNLVDAYKDLLYATQLDPADENAMYYLAKVLFKQQNYPIALQFFDNAIAIDKNRPEMYIDRGICKIELENFKSARVDFYKSLQLNSTNKAYAEYQLARSYAAEGSKRETIEALYAAKKDGLFIDGKYFGYIAKDRYFTGWAKDKEFMTVIQDLKFGKR